MSIRGWRKPEDTNRLLWRIAEKEAENPQSEAVLAALSLFKTIAECKPCRTFAEASQPEERE